MFSLDTAGPLDQVLADLNACIGQTVETFPESAQVMTEGQRFIGVLAIGKDGQQPARLTFNGTRDNDLNTMSVALTFSILPPTA